MQPVSADTDKPTILVVDDDRGTVQLMRIMLETRGYSVAVAYSGVEAIQLLEELVSRSSTWRPLPVDVILLDVMMPGIDGFKVCQRVKEDPLLRYIPIVMVTALDSPSDKLTAVEFGADGYLSKPFLPEELGAAVKAKYQIKQRDEALLRHNRELMAINAISAAATSTLDPQRVLTESLAALMDNMDLAAAAIYRYEDASGVLRRVVQRGVSRPKILSLDESLPGEIARAQYPVLKVNLDRDPDLPPESLGSSSLGAFIGVPLRGMEQLLGTIEVYHERPYGFVARDLGLLMTVSERISIALQNAEVFAHAQKLLIRSSSLATGLSA
jgi:CheY-like chemotaxis protein